LKPFKQVDVLPMVKHFMDELELFSLFTKYVPAAAGSFINHAESLCVLTANIICDNKPLYKVQEWLSKYSDGLAEAAFESGCFNDDRLARSLSALFRADRHSLMTEISSNAIRVHKLLTDEIHNDSTTVTFIGQYDTADSEAVKLKHGHNKDFRPDCKQLVFGLNITADGIFRSASSCLTAIPQMMSRTFRIGTVCANCWEKKILFTWPIVSCAA
jgi:transposase